MLPNLLFSMHACLVVSICVLCCVWLFVTLWTVAHQASLSIGFSQQEHWSEFPLLSPKDLPDPQIEHTSPVSPALADRFFTYWAIGKPTKFTAICFKCLNLLYFWHTLIDFLIIIFFKSIFTLPLLKYLWVNSLGSYTQFMTNFIDKFHCWFHFFFYSCFPYPHILCEYIHI